MRYPLRSMTTCLRRRWINLDQGHTMTDLWITWSGCLSTLDFLWLRNVSQISCWIHVKKVNINVHAAPFPSEISRWHMKLKWKPTYFTKPMPLLLMVKQCNEPGIQQQWYIIHEEYSGPSIQRVNPRIHQRYLFADNRYTTRKCPICISIPMTLDV